MLPTLAIVGLHYAEKGLAVMGVIFASQTIEAFVTDIQPLVTATAEVWPSCHPYQQQ
jgi:hypothetical protein